MVKVWPLEDWGPLRGASVMNFNVKTIEIFSLDKDIFLKNRILSVQRKWWCWC